MNTSRTRDLCRAYFDAWTHRRGPDALRLLLAEDNMASFNPRAKNHVSLLFHTGASIPGSHPRLTGGGETARYMQFADLDDVEAAADQLRAVTHAWCDSRAEA